MLGSRSSSAEKGARCEEIGARGPATLGAEVMLGCWRCPVGPRDEALSEELGEVGVGSWGQGRGSLANNLRTEPGNHFLLIKLDRFSSPKMLARESSSGCALAILKAGYHNQRP